MLTTPSHRSGTDIDGKHVAEQQRRCLSCVSREEVQKQQPKTERERQDDADRDIALGQPLAHCAHADPRRDSQHHQTPDRRHADQNRARGAGETDMGKRMTGKRLSTQHEEIADQTRDDRDDRRRREGMLHEVVFKHRWAALLAHCASACASTRGVVVAFHILVVRYDEDPALQSDDVDLRSVKTG